MGKSFDKRLKELGATPFHASAFADEATNMEETVEPWLSTLFSTLLDLQKSAGDGGEPRQEPAGATPIVNDTIATKDSPQESSENGLGTDTDTVQGAGVAPPSRRNCSSSATTAESTTASALNPPLVEAQAGQYAGQNGSTTKGIQNWC